MNYFKKTVCQSVVSVFETGKAAGDYSCVTMIPGDTGGLTYGVHQCTLMSGGLYKLVKMYIDANGPKSDEFYPFLDRLEARDQDLNDDYALKDLLKAATDGVMIDQQNIFFDTNYWNVAQNHCKKLGVETYLGQTVVYDSIIQGSFATIRNQVTAHEEKQWVQDYINIREDWLRNKSAVLAKTVYRMESFQRLIDEDNWNLRIPFIARDTEINGKIFRMLRLNSIGADVRFLNQFLQNQGYPTTDSQEFDSVTDSAVRGFQASYGLGIDGIVGKNCWNEIGNLLDA